MFPYPKSIQPSINLWDTPEKYNGWHDWTTWNVALWINNEESIYNIAKDCNDYIDFLFEMQAMCGFYSTPDGADYGEANLDEMNELIHVDQNVRGLLDDEEREKEAYSLEHTLTNQFLNKC